MLRLLTWPSPYPIPHTPVIVPHHPSKEVVGIGRGGSSFSTYSTFPLFSQVPLVPQISLVPQVSFVPHVPPSSLPGPGPFVDAKPYWTACRGTREGRSRFQILNNRD